jgi:hypothetical protein
MSPQAIAYEEDTFHCEVMRCEIKSGIHKYRKRNPNAKLAVKYELEAGHTFF